MTGIHPLFGEAHSPSMSMARLARLARVSGCTTAATAAVAGLSLPKLLAGTPFYDEPGVPTSAFQRGSTMERLLAENGHARLIALCREHLGFELTDVVPVNLRESFQRSREGLAKRARETRRHVASMLAGGPDAPNLLDGAVLTYQLGDEVRYAEVDGTGLKAGGKLHVIEVKSHPLVNGQLLGGDKGAWKLQIAVYIGLLRDLVADLGYDPDDHVSDTAMLVLARNTTIQPTATLLDLRDDRQLARITLERLAAHDPAHSLGAIDPQLLPASLPPLPEVEADPVADPEAHARQVTERQQVVEERLERVSGFIDALGTDFGPECLDNCEMYRLCRERHAGRIVSIDRTLARGTPDVTTFAQVTELAADPAAAPAPLAAAAAALADARADLELAERLAREVG